jgi:hypothetical protein
LSATWFGDLAADDAFTDREDEVAELASDIRTGKRTRRDGRAAEGQSSRAR